MRKKEGEESASLKKQQQKRGEDALCTRREEKKGRALVKDFIGKKKIKPYFISDRQECKIKYWGATDSSGAGGKD